MDMLIPVIAQCQVNFLIACGIFRVHGDNVDNGFVGVSSIGCRVRAPYHLNTLNFFNGNRQIAPGNGRQACPIYRSTVDQYFHVSRDERRTAVINHVVGIAQRFWCDQHAWYVSKQFADFLCSHGINQVPVNDCHAGRDFCRRLLQAGRSEHKGYKIIAGRRPHRVLHRTGGTNQS